MGKSRANAEYMQQPQPTATERLQKALNRPVNEAIQIKPSKEVPVESDNVTDADKAKGRGQYINDMVTKGSR